MKIDIVVTQHTTLVALLIERGLITTDTPVIEHATAADVRGKHVLGVLPHHLSSQAASIAEIPLRFADAAERRSFAGGDIPLDRLREMAGSPVTYRVENITNAPEGGRVTAALALAIRHAAGPNGYGLKFLSNDHAAIIEVEDVDGWWRAQVDLYAGAVRLSTHPESPGSFGPWLDPMTGELWMKYRIDETGQQVPCCGYPAGETEEKILAAKR